MFTLRITLYCHFSEHFHMILRYDVFHRSTSCSHGNDIMLPWRFAQKWRAESAVRSDWLLLSHHTPSSTHTIEPLCAPRLATLLSQALIGWEREGAGRWGPSERVLCFDWLCWKRSRSRRARCTGIVRLPCINSMSLIPSSTAALLNDKLS